mmetsp:Transcript_41062/g.129998  ORF Transcript_41062/g.129998 Transcript_41062/m.129998 type:complete len:563 (+) Transcript_41062:203-1891(+)
MHALMYLKTLVITMASSYPFVALVSSLSSLDVEHYEPCNDGCVFIRFFSSGNLPASTPGNMQNVTLTNRSSSLRHNAVLDTLPQFVVLQNGHPVTAVSFWDSFTWLDWAYALIGLPSVLPASLVSQWVSTEQQYLPTSCPGMHGQAMQRQCESRDMRQHIENTLENQISLQGYLAAVAGWTAFKVLHDWAVLAKSSEFDSLCLGIVSFFFQSTACLMAYLWSLGALEVFVAKAPEQDCACYYQIPLLELVAALSTPLLLHYLTYTKLVMLYKAIQHGDYLYDVPFRLVHASAPNDPTGPMLIATLSGDSGMPELEPIALSFKKYRRLSFAIEVVESFWNMGNAQIIGPFIIGPLFVRTLIASLSISSSLAGFIRGALLSASAAALAAIIYCNVNHRLPKLRKLISCEMSDAKWILGVMIGSVQLFCHVTYAVATSLVFVELVGAFDRNSAKLGEQERFKLWTWSCSGSYIFYSCRAGFRTKFLVPVMQSESMQALEASMLSAEEWIDHAASHPYDGLSAHAAFAQRFVASGDISGRDFEARLSAVRYELDLMEGRLVAQCCT